ncbi:MAG: phosphatidylglycerophosphatase A [Oligoflexia bacterium]|nr:phosphatidylglycerophosphatase A [Oligoflexia bacterium]
MKKLGIWLATGLGIGLIPWAPGTFGSIAGVFISVGIMNLPSPHWLAATAVLFAAGAWSCGQAYRHFKADAPCIVMDEIMGQFIACFGFHDRPLWLIASFILFRIFDVTKPGPIGYLDRRIKGGLGVYIDDVAAGLITFVILHGLSRILI